MTARERNTVSTRRRNERMRFLIGELRIGPMVPNDIEAFLSMSPSGSRKYIQELREAGVIYIGKELPGKVEHLPIPVYYLSKNEEEVAKFIASIDQVELIPSQSRAKPEPKQKPSGLHCMGDDAYFKVRRAPTTIPKPDPLLAALFASRKA